MVKVRSHRLIDGDIITISGIQISTDDISKKPIEVIEFKRKIVIVIEKD